VEKGKSGWLTFISPTPPTDGWRAMCKMAYFSFQCWQQSAAASHGPRARSGQVYSCITHWQLNLFFKVLCHSLFFLNTYNTTRADFAPQKTFGLLFWSTFGSTFSNQKQGSLQKELRKNIYFTSPMVLSHFDRFILN
jgi:hypothetical protein